MKTSELRNLPIGTDVSWYEMNMPGKIVARNDSGFTIRWADGQEAKVNFDDGDLPEFAEILEVIDIPPDEPIFVG